MPAVLAGPVEPVERRPVDFLRLSLELAQLLAEAQHLALLTLLSEELERAVDPSGDAHEEVGQALRFAALAILLHRPKRLRRSSAS